MEKDTRVYLVIWDNYKLQNFLGFFSSIFLGGSEIVVIYKTLLKKCQISVNCYVITVEPVKDIFGSDTQTVLN